MVSFRKYRLRSAVNAGIGILVPACWFWLAFRMQGDGFMSNGLRTLKYFTVLSNFTAGAAAVLWLLYPESRAVQRLKLAAAVAVTITCLVVICFLGWIYGFPMMYEGPSLWLHLLIPLLCMADAVLLEKRQYDRTDCVCAGIPVFLYGSGYIANILVNGAEGNDWYAFAAWGVFPAGMIIFAVLILLSCGIGAAMAYLQKKALRKKV
jgi:hypothetical protein